MKRNIIIILIGLVIVFSFIYFKFFNSFSNKNENLYLLQVGAYQNLENAANISRKLNNYLVLKEADLYKIFIGITLNEEVYDKLKTLYSSDGIDIYKKVITLNDENASKEIEKYDYIFMNLDDKSQIDELIKEEFRNFEEIIKENI